MKTKNKAKLVDVKIPEYWIEVVDDYHEFKSIQQYLNNIGIKVKYEEVGYSEGYQAVFWHKEKPNRFIEETRMEFDA